MRSTARASSCEPESRTRRLNSSNSPPPSSMRISSRTACPPADRASRSSPAIVALRPPPASVFDPRRSLAGSRSPKRTTSAWIASAIVAQTRSLRGVEERGAALGELDAADVLVRHPQLAQVVERDEDRVVHGDLLDVLDRLLATRGVAVGLGQQRVDLRVAVVRPIEPRFDLRRVERRVQRVARVEIEVEEVADVVLSGVHRGGDRRKGFRGDLHAEPDLLDLRLQQLCDLVEAESRDVDHLQLELLAVLLTHAVGTHLPAGLVQKLVGLVDIRPIQSLEGFVVTLGVRR